MRRPQTRPRPVVAGLLLATALTASACAPNLPSAVLPGRATSSIAPAAPTGASPIPPQSSYCHGISIRTQAAQLTRSGAKTVLLLGTVGARPTARPRPGPRFQLTSYRVIAGKAGLHPLRDIIGDPVRGRHLFVLLWDGFAWEVAGGLDGDFLVSGSHAYQRCPNIGDHNLAPAYSRQGVTDLVRLERLLRRSFT